MELTVNYFLIRNYHMDHMDWTKWSTSSLTVQLPIMDLSVVFATDCNAVNVRQMAMKKNFGRIHTVHVLELKNKKIAS